MLPEPRGSPYQVREETERHAARAGDWGLRIYLAGPLFSEGDRSWQMRIKEAIQNWGALQGIYLELINPYELLSAGQLEQEPDKASERIFQVCRQSLRDSDLVVASLDGPQVDDGTAWELGYFFALCGDSGERILGIRTDFRNCGDAGGAGINSMLAQGCCRIAGSLEELLDILAGMVREGSLPGS